MTYALAKPTERQLVAFTRSTAVPAGTRRPARTCVGRGSWSL